MKNDSTPSVGSGSGTSYSLLPLRGLVSRELVRFYRQKSRIIGTLATPLLFWLALGTGLGAAFPAPATPGGKGFLEYFYPGILVLTVLFTSIFSNISLIEDRNEGFLQGVLVAPVTRAGMVAGKVLGGAILATMQGVIFLPLAYLAGFVITPASVVPAIVSLFAIAFALSSLGFYFAWKLDSVQGFHSIMNVVLMPMWLLSGSFFPIRGAAVWLKPIMYLNPLSYGFGALQQALNAATVPPPGLPDFIGCLTLTLLAGTLFFLVSVYTVGQRTNEVRT